MAVKKIIKNEDILSAVQTLTLQHQEAFSTMDGRVTLIENGIDNVTKTLEKVGAKVDGLVEQSIGSVKDIGFLKENLDKLETSHKKEIDLLWEDGIRGVKKNILETVADKIEKRALHERLLIYGTAIAAIFAVVQVLK